MVTPFGMSSRSSTSPVANSYVNASSWCPAIPHMRPRQDGFEALLRPKIERKDVAKHLDSRSFMSGPLVAHSDSLRIVRSRGD